MSEAYDILVMGGGPAGLAAAVKAAELGLRPLLIEARDRLGGVPLQCIHPGFGIHYFREDRTGPEFVHRFISKAEGLGIPTLLNAHVLRAEYVSPARKVLEVIAPEGTRVVEAPTLIYAVGARERSRYEIGVGGPNPAGVMTAGEAQTLMDVYGVLPGKRVLIVGSGDVGLIMARRFALEGAEVVGVVEILPYPSGLPRNVQQCLLDYGIPLYLRHAVVSIKEEGGRVSAAVVAEVGEDLRPVPGTEEVIGCDTVIIAAGLVPRASTIKRMGAAIDPRTGGPYVNEWLETSLPGVFAAGNALIINDYVDYAVEQGELAAEAAKAYIEGGYSLPTAGEGRVRLGRNVRLAIPQYVSGSRDALFYGRVSFPEDSVILRIKGTPYKLPLIKAVPAVMFRARVRAEVLREVAEPVLEVVPRA